MLSEEHLETKMGLSVRSSYFKSNIASNKMSFRTQVTQIITSALEIVCIGRDNELVTGNECDVTLQRLVAWKNE